MVSFLSLGPLLSSYFVLSAVLEPASTILSPESAERKVLQTVITALREEIEKLRSENLGMACGLKVTAAPQEPFHSQVYPTGRRQTLAIRTTQVKGLTRGDSNAERAAC